MTLRPDEAREALAVLAAAHPRQQLGSRTLDVYVRFLLDLDRGEMERATMRLVRRSPFFPSIAEIRTAVSEERLDLPTGEEAWAMIQRRLAWRPRYLTCSTCNGTGLTADDRGCPDCNGTGEALDEESRPFVHPLALEALYSFGGLGAVREADEPNILRAQFLKTYEKMRVRAVEREAVEGTLPPGEPRKELEP